MKRISLLLLAVAAFSVSCREAACDTPSMARMRESFRNVPDETPLAVYWYWVSDNISEEGVVRDLESMKEAGINRAFIGNIGIGDQLYGEHPLFSPEWWRVMHAALKRAGELGIEIGIFNSPGWSQSGGPWVGPQQSMRYLASARTVVEGPALFEGPLPEAGADAEDVRVIAYPLPEAAESDTKRVVKVDGREIRLDWSVSGTQPMRSLTIRVDRPVLTSAELYCREDGGWKLLKRFSIDRSNLQMNVGFDPLAPVVISLPETLSANYRLVIPAPGGFAAEATLSSLPQVERFPEKTLAKMFQTPLPMWHDYLWEQQPAVQASLPVDPAAVTDITAHFDGGTLRWEVPAGKWQVERLAMRSTTVTNGPASPEGLGLEIDKMSRKHVASHFDAFIGEILRRIPPEDRRTFKVVVQDSYETGGQNWTDDMAERFEEIYGYDPVPYLPVLHGTVVGSQDISDRFLWDLRRLIADRVSYDYVGGLREECHKHGLTTWLENYGHWGFPGEFLQYGGQSDEVAGEFWSEGSLGDIENRAASSCAHIYGKRRVWAESFTAGLQGFSRYPYRMKQRGDRFFTEGINSTLLHVYIHQPYEDRFPGMSSWFGNEFNRKNTWFGQLDAFTDYLKRCGYLLQQGRYVADAAYFIGEDAPKMTGVCDPALPNGYSFDYINAEVLLKHAKVRDGRLVLDGGMEYRVLVLPKLRTMRPELLDAIERMVRAGLTVLGPAPDRSPGLAGYPGADERVKETAERMWHSGAAAKYAVYGKGRVFNDGCSLEEVFASLSMRPDCRIEGQNTDVRFIHRTTEQGDIYFLSNQQERKVVFEAAFRTEDGAPELWDALTGVVRRLPGFSRQDGVTTVPLELDPYGSAFIVFDRTKEARQSSAENFPEATVLARVEGPWKVTFEGLEAPEAPVVLDTLCDWTVSDDPRIRYFSGTARYETAFEVENTGSGSVCVDLGKVMVMGRVFLNGVCAGGTWTPPYRVDVSGLIREGRNVLEVEVANNWMNRLIGDQRLPPEQRKTWTPVNPWTASSELQSSGLLGPVVVGKFDYEIVK